MAAKKVRKEGPKRPMLVKIEEIHIPKKDYPTSGNFPPSNSRFQELKELMTRNGQAVPVFIDSNKLLIQGHYRLWAWQSLGETFIKAIIVESLLDINDYFENIPFPKI